MQQRPEKFNKADGDPEATLVAPRFDDEEARRAHPVVPLAGAGAHAPRAGAYAGRGLRRSWPPALLAVALLAVAAVGGAVTTMFMRRAPSNTPAEQTPAAAAPAQSAEVPAQVEPPPAATTPREVAGARPETRAPRESQARRGEDAPVRARSEGGRDDWKDFEYEDKRDKERDKEREKARERRRERRERGEDEADKEMRKVLKRAADKAPRLVDVIVRPGN